MFEKYFKFVIETDSFINNINNSINKCQNKKIIIWGDYSQFKKLNKLFNLKDRLSIVGFIESKNKKIETKTIKQIDVNEIKNIDYDCFFVTEIQNSKIKLIIKDKLKVKNKESIFIFEEEFKEEIINMEYLIKNNFKRQLTKLKKKLNNKKVVLYGAGAYLKTILKYYDLSDINVIGIVDKRYKDTNFVSEICGYKLLLVDDILKLKPDYVVISLKRTLAMLEAFNFNFLEKTKIKAIPLVKGSLIDIAIEFINY